MDKKTELQTIENIIDLERKIDENDENFKMIMFIYKMAVKEVENKNSTKTVEKNKEKTTVAAAEAKSAPVRKINPSEFKKLRTIDEELIIYVVKSGDTLKSISENYYGTAAKERVIADLNFIEKSSAIRVGEEIIVEVRPLSKS